MTPSYSPACPNFNGIPRPAGISEDLVPDFVDESIRAEFHSDNGNGNSYAMYPAQSGAASPRTRGSELNSSRSSVFGQQISSSESEYFSGSEDDEEEGVDEAEMQRLTREHGFGLGSWVDRLVEWTLFGTESESAEAPGSASQFGGLQPSQAGISNDNNSDTQQTSVGFQSASQADSANFSPDRGNVSDAETEEESYGTETETEAGDNGSKDVQSAPLDDKGRWADMRWLLHVARNSL